MILIISLIAIVFAVKTGFKPSADLFRVSLTLAIGVALLVWFIRLQLKAAEPMLDLSLFAKPVFTIGLIMAFVASVALAGFELQLAQELQYVFGQTPLDTRVAFSVEIRTSTRR